MLVRTAWLLRLRGDLPHQPNALSSTFVFRQEQDEWRIILYLNHQDMGELFSSRTT